METDKQNKLINQIIPKPKLCCIDLPQVVTEMLSEFEFATFEGSLGAIRDIPNFEKGDSSRSLLDNSFPANLHEFDILIVDLTNEVKKDFEPFENVNLKTKRNSFYCLECNYPTNQFDPRPFSAFVLGNALREIKNKKFIQIIFAAEKYEIDYEIIEITDRSTIKHPSEKHDLYSFNPRLPISEPRFGKEVTICHTRIDIQNLLKKYVKDLIYEQTFFHPTEWNPQAQKSIHKETFLPLLKNSNDEIVSFVEEYGNEITFVFPNIKNKRDFTFELLKNILPAAFPEVFPFSTQFRWIENSEYFMPNHEMLLKEKVKVFEEYNKNNLIVQNKIEDNSRKFKFLHDLLIETDDKLVFAVFAFLNFLEFKNVILKDAESKSIKEEDIQVELDNGILVIETKGIGGTSTDSDCSQISKIKHRRCKERNSFDVWALYIVNHQRFLPPLSRKNPPFTQIQVEDAKNDERGLLTTWQLFNLFFDVQTGIISKSEAREQILEFGLIVFKPKISANLGKPKELFKAGQIAIINLSKTKIKVGCTIILEKDNRFSKAKIVSLQLNGIDASEAAEGEVGISLDTQITKATNLWLE